MKVASAESVSAAGGLPGAGCQGEDCGEGGADLDDVTVSSVVLDFICGPRQRPDGLHADAGDGFGEIGERDLVDLDDLDGSRVGTGLDRTYAPAWSQAAAIAAVASQGASETTSSQRPLTSRSRHRSRWPRRRGRAGVFRHAGGGVGDWHGDHRRRSSADVAAADLHAVDRVGEQARPRPPRGHAGRRPPGATDPSDVGTSCRDRGIVSVGVSPPNTSASVEAEADAVRTERLRRRPRARSFHRRARSRGHQASGSWCSRHRCRPPPDSRGNPLTSMPKSVDVPPTSATRASVRARQERRPADRVRRTRADRQDREPDGVVERHQGAVVLGEQHARVYAMLVEGRRQGRCHLAAPPRSTRRSGSSRSLGGAGPRDPISWVSDRSTSSPSTSRAMSRHRELVVGRHR